MDIELYASVFGMMIVPCAFLLFPELYFRKRRLWPFWGFAVLLAMAGVITAMSLPVPGFFLLLICPLYDLIILRLGLYLFRKALKRNPKEPPRNVFFLDEDGLFWDRVFYFIFMFLSLSLSLPMLLLACYH